MGEIVSHEGIVTNIKGDDVEVKILSKSACASCNIKTACNMSEMQEKIIAYLKERGLAVEEVEGVTSSAES